MGAVTHTKKTRMRVLEAFRRLGTILAACQAVGVDRSLHYEWKKKYPDYAEAFEAAAEPVADLILDEVHQRGLLGWDEPVFHGGKRAMDFARDADGNLIKGEDGKFIAVPAVIRKKSDPCLLALAAARVPGFSQKLDHRLVDKKGEDRKLLETEAVEAWMAAQPDDWKNEA